MPDYLSLSNRMQQERKYFPLGSPCFTVLRYISIEVYVCRNMVRRKISGLYY